MSDPLESVPIAWMAVDPLTGDDVGRGTDMRLARLDAAANGHPPNVRLNYRPVYEDDDDSADS